MEALEKIYLQKNTTTDCYGEFWPEWFEARAKDSDVEYTRTDAFIEKACEFLKDRIEHDSIDNPMATKHLVEDFKKYMGV